MANVFDVAKYIIEKQGQLTAMKLQKLVYYSQVWTLVWDEKPLFPEVIQAWGKGPVCPDLYKWHQGEFLVSINESLKHLCSEELTGHQKENIDKVLKGYGHLTAQDLSDLTHQENPWKEANAQCPISGHCDAEITHAMMHEYYSNLPEDYELK